MQNDPVNFVDPSGLYPEDAFDRSSHRLNYWLLSSGGRNGGVHRLAPYRVESHEVRARDVDYARSVYVDDLGRKLTKCINEVFSKYVDYEHAQRDPNNPSRHKVGRGSDLLEYQRLRNAPNIRFENMGETTMGSTHPLDYQKGFIRLSDHLIKSFEDGQRTYVHELGNYLSTKVVYWNLDTGNLEYFGDPKGIKLGPNVKPDNDSGAALEKCMFGVKE